MTRTRISSGSKWELILGYSRAIVDGCNVYVSGCSGLPSVAGEAPGSAATQMQRASAKLAGILEQAGSSLEQVLSTRVYLTDPDDWDEVGQAHGAIFGEIRPASTMVQVVRLIDPAMRIEIEAIASLD